MDISSLSYPMGEIDPWFLLPMITPNIPREIPRWGIAIIGTMVYAGSMHPIRARIPSPLIHDWFIFIRYHQPMLSHASPSSSRYSRHRVLFPAVFVPHFLENLYANLLYSSGICFRVVPRFYAHVNIYDNERTSVLGCSSFVSEEQMPSRLPRKSSVRLAVPCLT